MGKFLTGADHTRSVYTEEQVLEMRKMCKEGYTYPEIAMSLHGDTRRYKQIAAICTGRRWSHLPGAVNYVKRRPRAATPEEKMQRRKEATSKWRQTHPERAREVSRASMRRNRHKYKATKSAWNAANRDKTVLYARRALCKKHGISIFAYNAMLLEQNNVCAICNRIETERNGLLSIDHNHACCSGHFSCGKCIRGLLCNKCNQGLGCFSENPAFMKAAVAYTESNSDKRLQAVSVGKCVSVERN